MLDGCHTSSSSKLRESIAQYGTNSYYYAHSKRPEIPANAIVREGDGVVTGGQPVLLSSVARPTGENAQRRKLTSFAWSDEKDKIKIYIEDAAFLVCAQTSLAPVQFEAGRVHLSTDQFSFTLDPLEDAIDAAACSFKLSDKRLTVTLKKANTNKTWYSLKPSTK